MLIGFISFQMLPALNLLAYLYFKLSTGELLAPSVCREQEGSSCWHFMGQKQSGASPGESLGLLPPVSELPSQILVNTASLNTFQGLPP